jgi:hypothetical protein
LATIAKLAVPKKSCVTERHRSQMGLMVVCFSRSMNGLQVRRLERFAEHATELTVHAHVHVGIHEARHISQVRAQREHHVDVGADAFDQAPDLVQIAGRIERAIDRTDDVHPRLGAGGTLGLVRTHALLEAVLRPQPEHGAIGALPLVFVDRARQEALDARTLRRHAAADHLGDGAGDHDRRQFRVERLVRPRHGRFGAFAAQLLFAEAGHDDRQLVRWQAIGVVQHGRHGQILAAHGTVDDHLQALDGAEDVHGAPVPTGAVMIEHEHQTISCALRALLIFARCRL